MDPASADLVIGTSAGAIAGAQLRCGVTSEDLFAIARDTSPGAAARRGDDVFAPAWRGAMTLAQRAIGSGFVIGRSALRFPLPALPKVLRATFPGGLMRVADHVDLDDHLPRSWPKDPLWLATVDIRSGKRVILRKDGLPRADLQNAVLASAAVPGVYQPVRVAGRTLVDGGVHSNTNLDLLSGQEFDHAVIVAPLGLRQPGRVDPAMLALRSFVHVNLQRQAEALRSNGTKVTVFEPSAAVARLHGVNTLRAGVSDKVAAAAFEETLAHLKNPRRAERIAA